VSRLSRFVGRVGDGLIRLGLRLTGYKYAKLINHRSRRDRFVGRTKR